MCSDYFVGGRSQCSLRIWQMQTSNLFPVSNARSRFYLQHLTRPRRVSWSLHCCRIELVWSAMWKSPIALWMLLVQQEQIPPPHTSITMSARKIIPHEQLHSAPVTDVWRLDAQEVSRSTGLTRQPAKTNGDTSPCPNPRKSSISYLATRRIPQSYDSSHLSLVRESTSAHADNLPIQIIRRNAHSTSSPTYILSVVALHLIPLPSVLSEQLTAIIIVQFPSTTASTLYSWNHAPAFSALDPTHQSVAQLV